MGIFVNRLLVDGKVVCGEIKDDKFYLKDLNPTNSLKPPLNTIVFTKDKLDTTIEELKAVRDRL